MPQYSFFCFSVLSHLSFLLGLVTSVAGYLYFRWWILDFFADDIFGQLYWEKDISQFPVLIVLLLKGKTITFNFIVITDPTWAFSILREMWEGFLTARGCRFLLKRF